MQVAGLAGLAVMAPLGVRTVRADAPKYGGPFWIMIHAGGGWDPTYLTDPKGGTINNLFTADQIGTAGGIRYAPVALTQDLGMGMKKNVYTAQQFFEKHHGRMLALNGLDTTTNNHDVGTRTVWSGQLAEGYPSLAALIAGAKTKDAPVPMAFVSNGGYDATGDLVPLTRAGGVDALHRLAYPNRLNPSDPKNNDVYTTPDTASRIAQAQNDRLAAMKGKASLPVIQRSMGALYLARQSDTGLDALAQALDGQKVVTTDQFADLKGVNNIGDLQNLMQQAQMALVSFASGVAVSANLEIGGFDTHSQHDNNQVPQLMKILRALDYLYDTADAMGLSQSLYVVVGSDFGRTPQYNMADGKDHWNVTSMMFSGPGIASDRTVGASDDGFKPMTFDRTSLQPSATGIRINTNHVHKALRKLAGVDQSDAAKQYPLPGEDLALFGLDNPFAGRRAAGEARRAARLR
jgi:hypothetical protein